MVFVGSQGFAQYSVDGGTTWKTFGIGTRVGSVGVRQNIERVYVMGKRSAEAFVPLRYEGSWSIETHPVSISTLATDLGWDESVTTPVQFDLQIGILNGMIRSLQNAVVSRVSFSVREGEIVRMAIDGLFQQESVGTDTSGVSFSETGTPATFADSSVTLGGSSVGKVTSADISINVNPNPIYTIGSRYFQGVYLRAFEAEARMTVVMEDTSILNDFENLQDYASFVLNFGSAGSVTLNDVKISELSHSIEPNEIVVMDIALIAKTVTFG